MYTAVFDKCMQQDNTKMSRNIEWLWISIQHSGDIAEIAMVKCAVAFDGVCENHNQ